MNEAGTGPARTVTLKDQTTTTQNPRLDFLVEVLGILQNNISTYVDPVAGDTSYVVSPKLSDLLARLKSLRNQQLHQPGFALKASTIDTMIERYEKDRLNQGTPIAPTLTSGGSESAVPGGLAKGAHTRWVHWTSLLDVKALTEVRQVKVFIKQTGSDALGQNWRTGLRNAIANWASQSRGTAISFVETQDINTADLVLRGAYGLGTDGLMSYVVWLNPGPYIERIPSYGGPGNGTSVDLVFNIGYENNSVPISEKTKIGMVALANATNIGWIDTENWYWNFGDFTYIPGTLHTDGDPYTPGSSIMYSSSTTASTPNMTAGDNQLFQAMYPSHGITAKLTNNALTIVGYQSFTTIATNVNSFQTEGDTLIYSTNDGKLFRRVGLGGTNVQVWPATGSLGNVVSFTHSRGYLAVYNGNRIYSRTPTGSWQFQQGEAVTPAHKYRLDGEKLYVTSSNNYSGIQTIWLKYLVTNPSQFYAEWIGTAASSVTDYQALNGVFAVADAGNLWVKKDNYYGWNMVHANGQNGAAKRVYLSNDMVAFYRAYPSDSYGMLGVLAGGVGGYMWYSQDPIYSSDDIDACGNKLAYLQESAYLRVVDFEQWVVHEHYNIPGHYNNTTKVRLSGSTCEYVTIVDNTQTLWAKFGADLGTDYFPYQSGVASLTQRP